MPSSRMQRRLARAPEPWRAAAVDGRADTEDVAGLPVVEYRAPSPDAARMLFARSI